MFKPAFKTLINKLKDRPSNFEEADSNIDQIELESKVPERQRYRETERQTRQRETERETESFTHFAHFAHPSQISQTAVCQPVSQSVSQPASQPVSHSRLLIIRPCRPLPDRHCTLRTLSMGPQFMMYEDKEAMKDYSEIVVQYGFVTLFVSAFPLVPLLALANNVLEIHVDGYKLCHSMRRPMPHMADSVGIWSFFMSIQSNISVITNMALVCFTSDLLDEYTAVTKLVIFILAEHVLFLIKVSGAWCVVRAGGARAAPHRG
jgi:hypothetical protein